MSVEKAIEKFAEVDSDRPLSGSRITIRGTLPLPGGKGASFEFTRESVKIGPKERPLDVVWTPEAGA